MMQEVGKGAFGEVWRATYCGELVALKMLLSVPVQDQESEDKGTESEGSSSGEKILKEEGMMWSRIPPHPNIARLIGWTKIKNETIGSRYLSLITEWVQDQSVLDCIKEGHTFQ